ncbi:MAG: hypothetical protein AB8G17_16735 [Gammaproteobacteria bacterium]
MIRCTLLLIAAAATVSAQGQTMLLSVDNTDFQITNTFSDIDVFSIELEIDAPLAPGIYTDPPIVSLTYQVMGNLVAGTPSGFPAFDLQREITGADFYAQGSSLQFEIAASAVLTDGIQVAELVGTDVVLTFNGREVDNGRFHPALFELRADGSGRIQNSDNVPSLNPLNEVMFGAEYITDLMFDAGNTTVITEIPAPVVTPPPTTSSGGGGSGAPWLVGGLALLSLVRRERA